MSGKGERLGGKEVGSRCRGERGGGKKDRKDRKERKERVLHQPQCRQQSGSHYCTVQYWKCSSLISWWSVRTRSPPSPPPESLLYCTKGIVNKHEGSLLYRRDTYKYSMKGTYWSVLYPILLYSMYCMYSPNSKVNRPVY